MWLYKENDSLIFKHVFFLKFHKSNSLIIYSSIHIKSSSRCGSMNSSMIYLLLLVSCTSSPAPRATLSVLGTELLVLLEIPPKQWHNTQHSLSSHCPQDYFQNVHLVTAGLYIGNHVHQASSPVQMVENGQHLMDPFWRITDLQLQVWLGKNKIKYV